MCGLSGTGKSGSKSEMRRIAEAPEVSPSAQAFQPTPKGETAPIPVITARLEIDTKNLDALRAQSARFFLIIAIVDYKRELRRSLSRKTHGVRISSVVIERIAAQRIAVKFSKSKLIRGSVPKILIEV